MGLASIVALLLTLSYPAGFREGEWVNYSDFRFVSSVAMDQTTVYFGTTAGVIRYDKFANRWLSPLTITDGLPDDRIDNIAYDPSYDRLWVSTPLGNAYYQPTFGQWYTGGDFPVNLVRNDFRPSSLGMLTTDYGYTYQNGVLSDLFFRSYDLTRGVDDGFDHLFVGTWGFGPVLINPRYGSLQGLPFGPYSEDASALVRVGDKFWIGAGPSEGSDAGITVCDTSLQNWRWYVPYYMRGLSSARLTCAIGDQKVTWLGTDNGLVRFDNESGQFSNYPNFTDFATTSVTALAVDSAWVYIGTDNGMGYVSRFHESKNKKTKSKDTAKSEKPSSPADSTNQSTPLPGKNHLLGWYIYCLKVIDNYLYVGTNRGALRRPLGDYGDFTLVNTPTNMLSDDILDISQLGDTLLFATKSEIIMIDTKTGQSTSLTELAHFGQWHIRKIVADSAHVWVATDAGLWMYRFSDGYKRLFTTSDGMISSDLRSLELIGDYIWMATPRGVIRFLSNRSGRVD
jgi:ligand-binding sensor domain-containing protein